MNIVELSTGEIHPITILPINKTDFKRLASTRYFFNWKSEDPFEIYKLVIRGQNDILGLVSVEKIPEEWRIHIRLLTVSKEDKGSDKKFDRIAGNLIAFVSKMAVKEFGVMACVSLLPKSSIIDHYIVKYKMNKTGKTLSLEVPEIIDIINTYEDDE